jgi:hypothetical protein
MIIRQATEQDWPLTYPIYDAIPPNPGALA